MQGQIKDDVALDELDVTQVKVQRKRSFFNGL